MIVWVVISRFFLFYPFFFFNDTATTEIYTLSLHDALPIYVTDNRKWGNTCSPALRCQLHRSEEHTSELQSLAYLVCRLLLEKKKHMQNPQCSRQKKNRSNRNGYHSMNN